MPAEDDDQSSSEVAFDAPGVDEVAVVAWPLLWRRRLLARAEESPVYPWVVLATVLFGLFTVGVTITILSNALPRIAADLDSSISTLTWVLTGPLLAFAVVGPAAGKLGDLYGHRRLYVASMLCACLFAAASALAPNAGALIAFRLCGAATGAAVGPASLALINRLFPPERRAQAMGYWAMVGAGGPVVGVVVGGPVVEAFGWRWIFAAQVPLTLAAVLLALAILPETSRGQRVRFDLPGAAWLAIGITSLLLAVNRGPLWGWSSPGVLLGFALAPVALAAFLMVERRSPHPLLPLTYLRRRNVAAPLANQFFINFAYMGGFIITPFLLQAEFGYGEAHTGNLLISRPLAFAITGPVAGYLAMRVGERSAAFAGASFVVVSMIWMATLAPGDTDLKVIGALALSGVGLGTSAPAMAATLANSVAERDLGIVGATQQMVGQVGIVIGIQVMQTVQAARAASVGPVAAYGDAYLVGAAVAALGLAAAVAVRSTRARGAPEGAPVIQPVTEAVTRSSR
ncbi:MAG: MFS transporter [Acidimicrobiales bacterium]